MRATGVRWKELYQFSPSFDGGKICTFIKIRETSGIITQNRNRNSGEKQQLLLRISVSILRIQNGRICFRLRLNREMAQH